MDVLINSFEPNLYSLNDIHKASGGSASKKPAFYLRTLTARILNALPGERWEKLHVIRGGVLQGTSPLRSWFCPMPLWLSPDFYVRVLEQSPFISDLRNGERQNESATSDHPDYSGLIGNHITPMVSAKGYTFLGVGA